MFVIKTNNLDIIEVSMACCKVSAYLVVGEVTGYCLGTG